MARRRFLKEAGWVSPSKLPKGPNGRALCRWCETEVPKGRRTFCSNECVHEHRLRTSASYVRQCLSERDHGVCAECGLDTEAEQVRLWDERPAGLSDHEPRRLGERNVLRALCGNGLRERPTSGPTLPWYLWAERFRERLGAYPWKRRLQRFWDADHIKPVDEDGGLLGLDNFQTLCLRCHKRKTAEQKRRKAKATKGNKMADKPTPKQMNATLREWMQDEDNKPHRLVSAAKLKEMAKAIDPSIRLGADLHGALCKEVALMIKKAMQRCYDNKRQTIRPLDL